MQATTVTKSAPSFKDRLLEAFKGTFGTYFLVIVAFLIVQEIGRASCRERV